MSRLARVRVVLIAALVVLVVPVANLVSPTEAAWNDSEYASSGVASGFVARPNVGQACTSGALAATFYWSPGTGGVARGGYIATAYLNGVQVGTPVTYAANATQGTTSGLLTSLLDNRTYEIRLQAYHSSTAPDGWRSPYLVGTITTAALGLITGCTGLAVPSP